MESCSRKRLALERSPDCRQDGGCGVGPQRADALSGQLVGGGDFVPALRAEDGSADRNASSKKHKSGAPH